MRRAGEIPAAGTAAAFLADTLDWLNLWHHGAGELDDEHPHTEPNRLFPHL